MKAAPQGLVAYFEKVGLPLATFLRGRAVYVQRGPGPLTLGPGVQRARDLTAYAALGSAELYSPSARLDHPRRPDWIVLELVAPTGAPGSLLGAVTTVQALLAELELDFVWKLVDPASLQVLLPIERLYGPAAVLDFATMLAELVFEREPTQVSLRRDPGSRRAHLSVKLNHLGALVLAPFAICSGYVALPVSWEFLRSSFGHEGWAPAVRFEALSPRLIREGGALLESRQAHPNDIERAFGMIENLVQLLG